MLLFIGSVYAECRECLFWKDLPAKTHLTAICAPFLLVDAPVHALGHKSGDAQRNAWLPRGVEEFTANVPYPRSLP